MVRLRMRSYAAVWMKQSTQSKSSLRFLAEGTSMPSFNDITIAKKRRAIRRQFEAARLLGLPQLATNAVCYATAARRQLADVLTCVRNHVKLETAGRLLAKNSERFLKPASTMSKLFADLPEAIANTCELSSRLEFSLQDLGYEFPKYPVPDGETMDSFLRKRTYEGARWRYGKKGSRFL
jgi:DNA polymerase III alpha subunit